MFTVILKSATMTFHYPLLYLDPGSGSLLFQVLLSAMLTVAVFFKRVMLAFRVLFSHIRLRRHKQQE